MKFWAVHAAAFSLQCKLQNAIDSMDNPSERTAALKFLESIPLLIDLIEPHMAEELAKIHDAYEVDSGTT